MATIVIHAGMAKAGSTSIQKWLAQNAGGLAETGVCVLVAKFDDRARREGPLRLSAYRSGVVVSNPVFEEAGKSEASKRTALLESFLEQLDAAASRHRVSVVTAEFLQHFFTRVDEQFLGQLDALAGRHEVRVAYYVRPQHTALEAGWREWGFRSGRLPSQAVAADSRSLHHLDTLARVRRLAPRVSLEPRPFRADLLDLGSPAADFARRFLGLSSPPSEADSLWANRGLPLELVNALRHAPAGLFWSRVNDNSRLKEIKRIPFELDSVENEEIARSRLLLQAYCHETFEPGNQRLIEAMGWDTDNFVPAPEDDRGDVPKDLSALDELWEPKASEAELKALYAALDHAISSRSSSSSPESRHPDEAEARKLLEATSHDIARVERELAHLRATRTWRLYRRIARLRRRSAQRADPAAALSKRLERAARRVRRLDGSRHPEVRSEQRSSVTASRSSDGDR